MSILAFNINEFTKRIDTTKFALGKIYAMTLDPDEEITFDDNNNILHYRRCFIINADGNGTRMRANDANTFSNPISANEPVICMFMKQIYAKNCSIVFFKFMPEKMFLAGKYPEGSIGDPLIERVVLCDDIGYDHIVNPGYKSNTYIITDNIDNIFDVTASIRTGQTFDLNQIPNMKFVINDQHGNTVEIDKETLKLLCACKNAGLIDNDGNYIPLYENDLDIKSQQAIAHAFNKTTTSVKTETTPDSSTVASASPTTDTTTTTSATTPPVTPDPDPSTPPASTTTTPAA